MLPTFDRLGRPWLEDLLANRFEVPALGMALVLLAQRRRLDLISLFDRSELVDSALKFLTPISVPNGDGMGYGTDPCRTLKGEPLSWN